MLYSPSTTVYQDDEVVEGKYGHVLGVDSSFSFSRPASIFLSSLKARNHLQQTSIEFLPVSSIFSQTQSFGWVIVAEIKYGPMVTSFVAFQSALPCFYFLPWSTGFCLSFTRSSSPSYCLMCRVALCSSISTTASIWYIEARWRVAVRRSHANACTKTQRLM